MKVTVTENAEALGEEVNHLALDCHGELWLIVVGGAVCLDDGSCTIYDNEDLERAKLNCGPFTKFNGTVTLEND